jgi:Fe-S-cluster containining protein
MEYSRILEKAKSRKKQIRQLLDKLQKLHSKEVDEYFHEEHEEIFKKIDCLKCANCCKTTGPLFTQKDIERIARHFKQKPGEFIDQYLRIDEDKDYVLKSTPCIFLDQANYCTIYSIKPKACGEFPHTDRRNMKEIQKLTYNNALVCPAVSTILENIEAKLIKKGA